ncbi:MAG: hypothetical protein ACJ8GN_10155 [Longimicrobiaceae bacterium]
MPRLACWFLAATALTGCASLAPGYRVQRPLLVVEGRTWNAPLLNPRPPKYGLGNPGGCIVWAEFQVAVERLAYDTATGRLRMEGRLFSQPEMRAYPDSAILEAQDEHGRSVKRLATRLGSTFVLELDLEHTHTLSIISPMFRTLLVDLRKLSRRAARAPDRVRLGL